MFCESQGKAACNWLRSVTGAAVYVVLQPGATTSLDIRIKTPYDYATEVTTCGLPVHILDVQMFKV